MTAINGKSVPVRNKVESSSSDEETNVRKKTKIVGNTVLSTSSSVIKRATLRQPVEKSTNKFWATGDSDSEVSSIYSSDEEKDANASFDEGK